MGDGSREGLDDVAAEVTAECKGVVDDLCRFGDDTERVEVLLLDSTSSRSRGGSFTFDSKPECEAAPSRSASAMVSLLAALRHVQ